MPYKYKKSRNPKRNTARITKTAIRREVMRMAESKYIQTDCAASISTSGVFLPIALINQGDYSTDRVGNKVHPTSWAIRGSITCADNFNYIRMVLVQWNDDNLLNPPLITNIFEVTSGNSPLYSTFNRQQLGNQYRVLLDKLVRVTANAANPELNASRIVKFKGYKGLKEMTFQGNNTTGFGQIYLLLISDSTLPSHPSFEGFSVVNYKDL